MIVTKSKLQEVSEEFEAGLAHLSDAIDNVAGLATMTRMNVNQAVVDAVTALQRADQAARAATDAAQRATDADLHSINTRAMIDPLRSSLDRAYESIRRQDAVIAMLLDYLNAEVVYEPERVVTEDGYVTEHEPSVQYIQKRKARR